MASGRNYEKNRLSPVLGLPSSGGLVGLEIDVMHLFDNGVRPKDIAAQLNVCPDRTAKILATYTMGRVDRWSQGVRDGSAKLLCAINRVYGPQKGAQNGVLR
jgi:hypothetical protein